MKQKIDALEKLATELVGDGKSPNLFFVTEEGVVTTVTRSFSAAYSIWEGIAQANPRKASALEDRQHGVVCSVDQDDETKRWHRVDDSRMFRFVV